MKLTILYIVVVDYDVLYLLDVFLGMFYIIVVSFVSDEW